MALMIHNKQHFATKDALIGTFTTFNKAQFLQINNLKDFENCVRCTLPWNNLYSFAEYAWVFGSVTQKHIMYLSHLLFHSLCQK
jgi:hypothetical protein